MIIYIPCTSDEAIKDELTISGRTILHSRAATVKEAAQQALIRGFAARLDQRIDKMQAAGIVRSSALLDLYSQYDQAVRFVVAGETRLMFLGKWFWVEEIAE